MQDNLNNLNHINLSNNGNTPNYGISNSTGHSINLNGNSINVNANTTSNKTTIHKLHNNFMAGMNSPISNSDYSDN